MVADDWSECPSCHFPALYSEFKKYACTIVNIYPISLLQVIGVREYMSIMFSRDLF